MEFRIGDKVHYIFPTPINSSDHTFSGTIENIMESFVIIRNEKNICLKVSYKNYEQILPAGRKKPVIHRTENFSM